MPLFPILKEYKTRITQNIVSISEIYSLHILKSCHATATNYYGITVLITKVTVWLLPYHPDTLGAAERERESAFCLSAAALYCSRADTRGLHLLILSITQKAAALHFITYNVASSRTHKQMFFFFFSQGKGRLRSWANTSNREREENWKHFKDLN